LYRTRHGSDFTIVCQDRIYPGHRKVICPQSPYFEHACRNIKEGMDGVVELHDKQPHLVEAMLEYLYLGDYNVKTSGLTVPDVPNQKVGNELARSYPGMELICPDRETYTPCFHAMMHGEALHFGIRELEALALIHFRASFLKIRDQEAFMAAIFQAYQSPPNCMWKIREVVIEIVVNSLEFLSRKKGEPQILDDVVLDFVPEFCRDLCIAALK
ncbi:hypothetical protein BO70DRAFT_258066, partial [Aspergillus heteromorphus CBS 117.55]